MLAKAGVDDEDQPESHLTPPPSVVLSSGRLPSALPLVAMFREDFERICQELETGHLSGQEAAAALRAAKRRPDEDLSPSPPCHSFGSDPVKKKELVRALRVLGVPQKASIGREVPDLNGLQLDLAQLAANLRVLCGEAISSKVQAALMKAWPSASPGESPTIVDVVKLLTKPDKGSSSSSSGGSSGQAAGRRRRCFTLQCLWQCCKCIVECLCCIRLFRCCRRCCRNTPRRHVPLEELLVRPKHDLRKCVVCAGAWEGLPATAENVKFRRMPLTEVSRQQNISFMSEDEPAAPNHEGAPEDPQQHTVSKAGAAPGEALAASVLPAASTLGAARSE